jgi:hypothetical protein
MLKVVFLMPSEMNLHLEADLSAVEFLLNVLASSADAGLNGLKLSDELVEDCARIEILPANGTGCIRLKAYPSDRLMDYVAAVARDRKVRVLIDA